MALAGAAAAEALSTLLEVAGREGVEAAEGAVPTALAPPTPAAGVGLVPLRAQATPPNNSLGLGLCERLPIQPDGRPRTGSRRCSLCSRQRLPTRTVPGPWYGPFLPGVGLAVGVGSDARKRRPLRTPSSSAKFALLPRPAPRTKNCAAAYSPVWRPLSLAPRPLLPLLLPVQRWEREEGEGDIFSEIVKNNWNDGFASAPADRKQDFSVPTKSSIYV